MSVAKPLPSIFGRFTAILQDHEQLAKTLRRLRSMCGALEAGQTTLAPELRPPLLLVDLRKSLAEHFAAEESEQYFGTVVSESPSLVSQVAGLKWEHMTMLQAADLLSAAAKDPNRWPQLVLPTRDLIGLLERHEGAESALLRKFFGG